MLLSILIRNLNESAALLQTLQSIKKQLVDFEYEIVFIDNESNDDSIKIAESFNCKIFSIPRSEFTFGFALNYGISKCKGRFILIMSAHLILLNELFLQQIPSYFNVPNIAALRFIMPEANLPELLYDGVKKLLYSGEEGFADANWKNFIVNHCAAVRRSAWEQLKFDEDAIASEDKIWSLGILQKGYAILYHVPLFYMYVKQFNLPAKIMRSGIEGAAKEKITGKKFDSKPFVTHMFKSMKRGVKQWRLERTISKSIKDHLVK